MSRNSFTVDRSKLGKAKRHILTDKNGIAISLNVLSTASTHVLKAVTNVIDNAIVINRPNLDLSSLTKERKRRKYNHLCLDGADNS